MTAIEILDGLPVDDIVRKIPRDEHLLLSKPTPGPMKLWGEYDLLEVVSMPTTYTPSKFAPPLGVYESDFIRIEWQKMIGRQPFYHRNADVDEISYHVCGTRTLITDRDSVDLTPGDFARIPVGVAHDNHGVDDVHLLFYIPAPVTEVGRVSRTAKSTIPPFDGWVPQTVTEMMTECLGALGCDRAVSLTDEKLLLDSANNPDGPLINVLRGNSRPAVEGAAEWLYKSEHIFLGSTTIARNIGRKDPLYHRHRKADEIQIQTRGHRVLLSQRGLLTLEPGDFVYIPLGCAFTSIVEEEESTHISVLTRYPATARQPTAKRATEVSEFNLRKEKSG